MRDDDAAGYHYHLFVSYTRTPDGELAREVERFLEGFHAALPTVASGSPLQALRVCVDGSDFNLPPPDADARADGQRRDVLNVVFDHLARSRELLLLCSRHAARTRWVEEEVRWFIEQRGAGSVRLAFTEGDDQGADPEQWFPAAVRAAGLTGNIAYDLRGYDERRARDWRQVADFNRELVRLAADLNGVSGGDLYPTWLEGELARARTQSLELATSARFETLAGDPTRALLKAVEAHEIHPAPETENALRDACRVAVLHHYNRRETAMLTGAGPGYLAARWKQGEVFVRTSPDGRYRVLVTARGKDGPKPAGDVYLVSNESQRVVELAAPERSRRRVEEVAFSDDSRRVLVTRYFDLTVYGLDGDILGAYAFSRHTKSPVHLLAGPFRERYLIGAETKGGVWLIDPEVGKAATVCVLREWHGDPSMAVAIAPGGRQAALVFESGRVALLALDDAGEAVLVDVPHPGALYAGWLAGREDRLLTAGCDGVVRLWDSRAQPPALLLASDPVAPAIDWVVASDDGRRLCAVGADRRLYLLDSGHGRHLATLDHDADIDWEALRVVRLPPEPPPLPLLEAQATMAWPDDGVVVTDRIVLGEQTWLTTIEPGDGEYALPIHKAWRIENDIACLYATHVSGITRHADMLWLHSSFGSGGTLLWIDGDRLRRFPNEPVSVRVLLVEGDVVWVGSERGGYRHQGSDHRLVTPADASVNLIERIDRRLWFATTAGAFAVEDTRTLQVSEPFVNVTALRRAAGHTWLLTRADSGGFLSSDGPAFVVDGCFARALPASRAPVGKVLEAAGHAWLCTEHALHRFDGTWLRSIEGLERPVSTLVEDGDTLVATTASWGLFPSAGPVYRIDPERLTLTVIDDAAGPGTEPAGG